MRVMKLGLTRQLGNIRVTVVEAVNLLEWLGFVKSLHSLEMCVMKLGLTRQLGNIRVTISRGRKLIGMNGVSIYIPRQNRLVALPDKGLYEHE